MAESYAITAILEAKVDGLVNGFKKATSTVDGFVKKNEKTFESFKQVGKLATVAGVAVAGGLMFAVKKAADFEGGISKVAAISGATGKDLDDLTQAARDWGASTSFSATEAAEGLEYMALAGWDTGQMLGGLGPILHLAEAGAIDLGRASDLVTDSMAGLGLEVGDLDGYLDKVAKTAASSNTDIDTLMEAFVIAGGTFDRFNVPLEESNAFLGILANRGFKGAEAGTAVNAIMSRLTQTTGPAAKQLKKMGISAFDSQGKFKGMEFVMQEVTDSMNGMTDAEKANAVEKLAGLNHGKTFSAMVSGLGDEYQDLKGKIIDSDGALKKMRDTMKDNLQGAMENLSSAFEEIAISIGTALLPFVKKLAAFAQKLADKFNGLSEKTKTLIAIVLAISAVFLLVVGSLFLLIGFIPAIIAGFAALGTVFTAIGTAVGFLLSPIALIVAAFIAAAVLVYVYWTPIKKFFIQLWASIEEPVMKAFNAIKKVVVSAFNFVSNFVKKQLDKIKKLWDDNGGKVLSAVKGAYDKVKNVVMQVVKAVTDFVDKQLDKIRKFWDDNGKEIMTTVKDSFEKVKEVILIVMAFISKHTEKAFKVIKKVVKSTMGFIVPIIVGAMGVIKGIFESVWALVSGFVQIAWKVIKTVVESGIDLVLGIIKTVMKLIQGDWEGAWEAILETVTKIIDNVVSFFKDVDLVRIGKDMIAGLIKGLLTMGDAVKDAVAAVWEKTKEVWEGISEFLGKVWAPIKEAWEPIGTWIEEAFISTVEFLTTAWEDFKTAFVEKSQEVLDKIIEIWEAIDVAVYTVSAIILGLFIPTLVTMAISAVANATTVILSWISIAASATVNAAIVAAQWVVTSAAATAAAIIHAIKAVPQIIASFVLLAIEATVNAVKVAAQWVVMSAAATTSALIQGVKAVGSVIAGLVSMAVASGVQAVRVVASWIVMSAAAIANAAIHVAQAAIVVGGWVFMGVQSLIQAGRMALAWVIAMGPVAWVIGLVLGLAVLIIANWDTIKSATSRVWTAISLAVKAAWVLVKKYTIDAVVELGKNIAKMPKKVVEFVGAMKKAGSDLIMGVIKGITGKVGEGLSAIGGFAKGLLARFKKDTATKSPSQAFANISRWFAPGVVSGIDKTSQLAINSVSGFANDLTNAFSPDLALPKNDIDRQVSSINAQANSQMQSHLTSELNVSKQPAIINVHVGNKQIASEIVGDITELQNRSANRRRRLPRN